MNVRFVFRDLEDTSLEDTTENLDRNSLASFGSGNTTDSDKVSLIKICINILTALTNQDLEPTYVDLLQMIYNNSTANI